MSHIHNNKQSERSRWVLSEENDVRWVDSDLSVVFSTETPPNLSPFPFSLYGLCHVSVSLLFEVQHKSNLRSP